MRIFFNGLLLGMILGAAGFWFFQSKAREHPETQQRYEAAANQAGGRTDRGGHGTAHGRGDLTKVGAALVAHRVREVGVVENIEEVCAEPKPKSLGPEREILPKA